MRKQHDMTNNIEIKKLGGESKIDCINKDAGRKSLLKYAVIGYYQIFLSGDCVHLNMIETSGGTMTHSIVREISRDYKISRSLKLGKDNDIDNTGKTRSQIDRRTEISDLINQLAQVWRNEIGDRASNCASWARKLEKRKLSSKPGLLPASAVSKLIWFLRPNDWTVFDSLASKAIIPTAGGNSVDRMTIFYHELGKRGFVDSAQRMQKVLDRRNFEFLYGTRIIDRFLVLIGLDDEQRNRAILHADLFLGFLPASEKRNIEQLAQHIAEEHGDKLLKRPTDRGIK